MQITPEYNKSFRIIEEHVICLDDRGVKYRLVKFEGICQKRSKLKDTTRIDEGWDIIGNKLEKYSNGATAYDSKLYWKVKSKKLLKGEINGIKFEEVTAGQHAMFWQLVDTEVPGVKEYSDYGLSTTFLLK